MTLGVEYHHTHVANIYKEKKLQSRDATTFVLYENILLKWQQEQKKWSK